MKWMRPTSWRILNGGATAYATALAAILAAHEPADGPLDPGCAHVLADRAQAAQDGPRAVDVVDPPAAVPSPVAVLRTPEEVDGGPRGRMLEAVAKGAEELEPPPGEILRGWIQQGPVVGERDVIEDEAIVVGVEGSPAAVRSEERRVGKEWRAGR